MNIDREKIRIFLCALWPGGGYMYFGMMKKGTMVMALFTAVAGLTLTIGWKFLAFLLPVIWCYCFFDTFHVAKLPEEIREFEDQDCWDTVAAFVKSDPLKHFEEKKTLAGVLILLAALYTMIYGVFLPFFRWSEELRLVRMALTAIPPAVIAVLLFMVGRNILQKEQDRRDAEAGIAETDAPDAEETALTDFAGICVKSKNGRTDHIFSLSDATQTATYQGMKVKADYAVISNRYAGDNRTLFMGNGTQLIAPGVSIRTSVPANVLLEQKQGKWYILSSASCTVVIGGKKMKVKAAPKTKRCISCP